MKVVKSWFSKTQTYILLIIVVYCVIVTFSNPAFLTAQNLMDLIYTSSVMMVLALGVLVVLLSGGIDVSFTCVAIFSSYASIVVVMQSGIDNIFFAFAFAVAVGAALGAINAVIIHFFKIPTLIATLGTQSIFLGLMATIVGTNSVNTDFVPQSFKTFGTAKLFTITTEQGMQYGLSIFIIPVAILIVLTWFIIYKTIIGRGITALGNSESSAMRVGFNLFKIRMFLFMYVGALAAIAGIMNIAQVAWITPLSNQLIGGELPIIAAVVIGGTKLSGGEGTIFGTILGVVLIRLFTNTLVFLGLSTSWNNFFTGLVLVACLIGTSLQTYRRRSRMLLFEE